MKRIIFVIVIIAFVAVTSVALYTSWELYKVKSPKYQQQMLEKQTKDIVTAVGKLILLPKDETPQIATVSDVEALKKSQPFFTNGANGDQLLVFKSEAILYRPSQNKIINVGPINREQAPAGSTPAPTTPENQNPTPEKK